MKQNIQPKVKTRIQMSTTTKVIVAGSIMSILLTIAFLVYSNLQHKDALANGNQIVANITGVWGIPGTWNLNRVPINGDEVIIEAGKVVTVVSPVQFNGTIKVYGTLLFTNGKITMDSSSQIMIHEDGSIISNGPGSSDKLTIGSSTWQGTSITSISSPNLLNGSGAMGGNPLPITLISFNANKNGNAVKVDWETAMELNNEYFTLERSADGQQFSSIGEINGAGNSTERKAYSFYDDDPMNGENFYRLKQTDFDGKYEYSKVIRLKNEVASTLEILTVGPNPFKNNFTMEFSREDDGELDVYISNAAGAVVHQEKVRVNSGLNKYNFSDNKNLPNGIYFITIQDNDQQKFSKKLIKG